jgi:acyl-CoA synthetase (AMP-forming)/AMP-acid ligase II
LAFVAAGVRDSFPGGLDEKRVAIVGPDTAETAVALISVAAVATAAPLNPELTPPEFAAIFNQLNVDVLLVHVEAPPVATHVAAELRIPFVRYTAVSRRPAGTLELTSEGVFDAPPRRPRNGMALVLQTSGSTGRPKTVPLMDERIMITAQNIAQRLSLEETDCALSIMPLFHVHGILNVLLSSLCSGGSVFFGGRFAALRFFDWLAEADASWYSAVPAMHEAILARGRLEGRRPAGRLRFVRSSSAPLFPRTRAALEDFFGVPVLESYGMTEVDQIASQSLPPAINKVGSVGTAGGPEVCVITNSGTVAPVGEIGEVSVRGPNVFPGYESDPVAAAHAFIGDFFLTGDLGKIDADGHLWLVGRTKEVINRGGEKISPQEIDEVVLQYPGVTEAAAFGVPHPTLGEEVVLAVVASEPRPGTVKLQAFMGRHLAAHKLPARVWFVDALPRGPTGKLLRRELARSFGSELNPVDNVVLADRLEAQIAQVWCDILGLGAVRRGDRFASLGGTSLEATLIIREVEKRLGRLVPVAAVAKAETVAEFADALRAADAPGDEPL